MRRSEVIELLQKFKDAHARLSSLFQGENVEEAEFQEARDDFWQLIQQVEDCRSLLDKEQTEYVARLSSLAFKHRIKVRSRSLSQSRSRSPSSASLPAVESSSLSSSSSS